MHGDELCILFLQEILSRSGPEKGKKFDQTKVAHAD